VLLIAARPKKDARINLPKKGLCCLLMLLIQGFERLSRRVDLFCITNLSVMLVDFKRHFCMILTKEASNIMNNILPIYPTTPPQIVSRRGSEKTETSNKEQVLRLNHK